MNNNDDDESNRPKKKHKLTIFNEGDTTQGTEWDGNDYSCTYDTLFTISFNIWAETPQKLEKLLFQNSNQ